LRILCVLAIVIPGAIPAGAQGNGDAVPKALKGVDLEQHLGEKVPLDLLFKDESGRSVRLGDLLGDRPAILTLNYYRCPMLCTLELNGLVSSLRTMSLEPGSDFRIITVSIDPKEAPPLAAEKKSVYVRAYGRAGAAEGWHFLTGEEPAIEKLTESVGFRYAYDETTRQYGHAAGIMVLTPAGELSRYFYGVEYPPRDLRLALVESSQGKIGSLADKFLLFCFHYDPATGRYSLLLMRVMRAGGALTALVLGGLVLLALRRERAAQRKKPMEAASRAL